MKKYLLALASVALFLGTTAQDLPQPSPKATVSQRVGLTDFTIDYSRPSAKDRVVFGELVPMDQLWRTGANRPSTIEFNTDITFGGTNVPAGKYAILSIPGQTSWTVILSKNLDLMGTEGYEESDAVAKVSARATTLKNKIETFTIGFNNLRDGSADLVFEWEAMRAVVPIKVSYMDNAVKNIEAKLKEQESFFSSYNSAARFYLDNNLDKTKALEYAKKSTEMRKTFWNVYTLSLAHEANGNRKEAIAAAQESMKLAEEANWPAYVKMNQENLAKWSAK